MSANWGRIGQRVSAVLLLAMVALPVTPGLASGGPKHDGATQAGVHVGVKNHRQQGRAAQAHGKHRTLAVVVTGLSGLPGDAAGAQIAARTANGTVLTVTVTLSTTLARRDGEPAAFADLRVGDHLALVPAVDGALTASTPLAVTSVRDLSLPSLWLQVRAVVVSASPDGRSGSVTLIGTNRPRLLSGGTTISVTLAVTATDVPTGTTAGAPAQPISATTSVSGTDDVTPTTTVSTTTSGEGDAAPQGSQAPRLLVAGQVVLLRGLYDPASLTLTQARIVRVWTSARGHGQAKHNGEDASPKATSHGQHTGHHGGKN